MEGNKEVVILLCLFALLSGQVWSDAADKIQKAFDDLPLPERTAFEALGAPLLGGLKEAAKCVENKIGPIDICNVNSSYDPFSYIQECLNGSILQQIIENLMQSVPQLSYPFGIPPKVSKERCFTLTDVQAPVPLAELDPGTLPKSGFESVLPV